jgi:hypothetical protein
LFVGCHEKIAMQNYPPERVCGQSGEASDGHSSGLGSGRSNYRWHGRLSC